MLKNIKKRNEGFTIIEVLIVLAIAGLILLIVFLAVPALQRNQRNTARKNDAGRIGSALSDYISNNAGALPQTAANLTTVLTDAGNLSQFTNMSTGTGTGTANTFDLDQDGTTATVTPTAAIKANALVLVTNASSTSTTTGYVCSGGQAKQAGASPRNAALLYTVEPGGTGNWTWNCIDVSG